MDLLSLEQRCFPCRLFRSARFRRHIYSKFEEDNIWKFVTSATCYWKLSWSLIDWLADWTIRSGLNKDEVTMLIDNNFFLVKKDTLSLANPLGWIWPGACRSSSEIYSLAAHPNVRINLDALEIPWDSFSGNKEETSMNFYLFWGDSWTLKFDIHSLKQEATSCEEVAGLYQSGSAARQWYYNNF